MCVVIGIDPGLSGAMALVSHQRADVFDLPTIDLEGGGSVRRRVHAPALKQIILGATQPGDAILAVIEDLSAGGRDSSAQTVGSQYRTRGTIEATLELLGLAVNVVHATRWKRHFDLLGKDKGAALKLARALFPELAGTVLRRVADHNRAEALLIAYYGRQVLA